MDGFSGLALACNLERQVHSFDISTATTISYYFPSISCCIFNVVFFQRTRVRSLRISTIFQSQSWMRGCLLLLKITKYLYIYVYVNWNIFIYSFTYRAFIKIPHIKIKIPHIKINIYKKLCHIQKHATKHCLRVGRGAEPIFTSFILFGVKVFSGVLI